MPLELPFEWELPGQLPLWATLGRFNTPSWVRVAADANLQQPAEPIFHDTDVERAEPTYFPELGETCFIRPDGEITCVPTGSIWASERRDSGYVEIPAGETDVQPTILTEPPRLPYEEIPTDVEISVFEPETERTVPLHANYPGVTAGIFDVIDWGMGVYSDYQKPATPYSLAPNGASAMETLPPAGYSTGATHAHPPKCRRRRRRPLLTPTDLNTLAALKTITGNNDALKFAVMKAVRR